MMLNHYEVVRAEADYRRERITDQFRRAGRRRTRTAETTTQATPQRGAVRVRPAG
jgi:hypothetical protein